MAECRRRCLLTSAAWRAAWRQATAIAYHPGGNRLTVVDLDHADAIAWAQAHLPPTRTLPTTRGQHWLYVGTMPSSHGVRPGVDIKSRMAYARWLGPGTGTMTVLPDAARALAARKPATAHPAPQVITGPAPAANGACPHRTPAYLERGITMAEQRIVAVLSAHGRCGCLTDAHIARLFTVAQAKGETLLWEGHLVALPSV